MREDGARANSATARRLRIAARRLRPLAQRLADAKAELRGKLHFQFRVAPTGRVTGAAITKDTIGEASLASAAIKLFRRTRLPAR